MIISDQRIPIHTARPAVFEGELTAFRHHFGLTAFALKHRLAENPLFSVPALEEAAATWIKLNRPDRFVISGGQTRTDAKFSEMTEKERIAGAIAALPHSNSYIKISNINAVNPAYDSLLFDALRNVEALLGERLVPRVTWTQMTVFISSPGVVTPYHIDHEANFLCQISGEKDLCLFDPSDREVLTDMEIERFYSGDLRYRAQMQSRGTVFRLVPGVAVHHPPLAPHWVKNGSDVSISVSISFCMQELERRAHIYQVNSIMRKIGLTPTSPGRSTIRDALKAGGMNLISTSHPKSYHDAVFSGLDRLRAPFKLAKRLIGRGSKKQLAA